MSVALLAILSLQASPLRFGDSPLQFSHSQSGAVEVSSRVDSRGIRTRTYRTDAGDVDAKFVFDRLVGLSVARAASAPADAIAAVHTFKLRITGIRQTGGERRRLSEENEIQEWQIESPDGVEGIYAIRFVGSRLAQWSLELKASPRLAGSPTPEVRKAILDGLRPRVQRDLPGQPIKLMVTSIAQFGPHAFVQGRPVLASNGKSPDYQRTIFRQQVEDGAFDEGFSALLQRQGAKWAVREYAFGATDVPYVDWHQKHKAPQFITLGWTEL